MRSGPAGQSICESRQRVETELRVGEVRVDGLPEDAADLVWWHSRALV